MKVKTPEQETRKYLFDICWSSLERLDEMLTGAHAEQVSTTNLAAVAKWLTKIANVVREDIPPQKVKKIDKKTPRPKARREG